MLYKNYYKFPKRAIHHIYHSSELPPVIFIANLIAMIFFLTVTLLHPFVVRIKTRPLHSPCGLLSTISISLNSSYLQPSNLQMQVSQPIYIWCSKFCSVWLIQNKSCPLHFINFNVSEVTQVRTYKCLCISSFNYYRPT